MTDELEILLGEEQEEEELLPEWLSGKGAGQVPPQQTAEGADPGEEEKNGSSAVWAPEIRVRRGNGRMEETFGEAAHGVGEESAQSLYTVLMRTRRAVRANPPSPSGRIPLTREKEQRAGESLDLLRLDRAVQRDARRYDGGFTWQ